MSKKRASDSIRLTSFDDLFGTNTGDEQIIEIPLAELHSFRNHPFRVLDDEKMEETVESIKKYGVLTPGIVRQLADGGYEIVAGHRRKRACELAGLKTMPVIVKEYSDDEAVYAMVDTNIQREDILPSEKAHAYRMKYDAMKHQGSEGGNTLDNIGEAAGESGKTVQRYICLSRLSDALLSFVDDKVIPIRAGVELSYLKENEQGWIEKVICECRVKVTPAQAEKIRGFHESNELTKAMVKMILTDDKPKPRKFVLKEEKIFEYFRDEATNEEIEETIIRLLDEWKNKGDQ